MTIFEFVEQLCDIIGGEDAYYRFEKDELITMCKEMSDSHEELTTLKESQEEALYAYDEFPDPSSIL